MIPGSDMSVGPLMERLMANPSALVECVLQPVLEQLWRDGAFAAGGDKSPELAIASVLGNRLARVVATDGAPAPEGRREPSHHDEELALYEELSVRNSDVAAALGACDCWGQQLDCPFCDARGAPGWVAPDGPLFARYVYPAVKAFKSRAVLPRTARPNAQYQRKENGHVGRRLVR